jgi:hypothetical protein
VELGRCLVMYRPWRRSPRVTKKRSDRYETRRSLVASERVKRVITLLPQC